MPETKTSGQALPVIFTPGENCWRIAHAERFAFIVDGADYFVALRQAMMQARKQILLIGWDFDTRIEFGDASQDGGPKKLGDFLLWLADQRPELEVHLLRWGTGAIKSLFRGNTIVTVLRWRAHPRITLRLDSQHPLGGSHHQKIVAIDDSIAFCGGIDMTMERWDTREHLDDDPRRKSPSGRKLNPWHDATSAFDGDAARAIGDLARARWKAGTGHELPVCEDVHPCWPEGVELTPDFEDVNLAIARTLPEMANQTGVHEIEQAYIDMIAGAKSVIYAESQYMASREVARALASRLVEENPPEIVLITPKAAHGWLEPMAMDTARAQLVKALQDIDHANKLRIYHPRTKGGEWIYVHAKVVVIDDQMLRVGSSNLNNRSMRLDSECDVILACGLEGNADQNDEILRLRDDLLAEHLGVSREEFEQTLAQSGSLITAIEALRSPARKGLEPYEIPELSGFSQWLADNEILDPNGPEDRFEAPSKRGLFKGWSRVRAKRAAWMEKRRKRRAERAARRGGSL